MLDQHSLLQPQQVVELGPDAGLMAWPNPGVTAEQRAIGHAHQAAQRIDEGADDLASAEYLGTRGNVQIAREQPLLLRLPERDVIVRVTGRVDDLEAIVGSANLGRNFDCLARIGRSPNNPSISRYRGWRGEIGEAERVCERLNATPLRHVRRVARVILVVIDDEQSGGHDGPIAHGSRQTEVLHRSVVVTSQHGPIHPPGARGASSAWRATPLLPLQCRG